MAWIGMLFSLILMIIVTWAPKAITHQMGWQVNAVTLFYISRGLLWLWLILVWGYAVLIEHTPLLPQVQKRYSPVKFILSVFLILLAVLVGSMFVTVASHYFHWSTASHSMELLFSLGVIGKLITVVTAAVTEELIFRGYLLSRLEKTLRNNWMAWIISAVIFALAHLGYGTIINLLIPLVIGLIFGFYQQRYRNIWVLIVCHLLIDLYSLFLTNR